MPLTANELLIATEKKFARHHRRITFPSPIFVEVAKYEKIRGFMNYNNAYKIILNDKTWILARGESSGYPADMYVGDFIALKEDEGENNLIEQLKNSTYFKNSLFFAENDGELYINEKNKFSDVCCALLEKKIHVFTAREPRYKEREIDIRTKRHPVSQMTLYDNGTSDYLFEVIKKVLRES